MAHEIVQYDNVLNSLQFKDFSERDYDFFMSLCARLKNLGEDTQTIELSYIMELISWDKSQSFERFVNELDRMNVKLSSIRARFRTDEKRVVFVLFPTFTIDIRKRILRIRVNPDFKFLLNDLAKNFTAFELREFVGLTGRYCKAIYAHLRQYKKTGWWRPTVDDLRTVLDIPQAYSNKIIMRDVLRPAVETLKSCKGMSDLSVEPVRSAKRGRPITHYHFSWTPSDQVPGQMNLADVMNNQKVKKTRKKKNAFTDYPQHDYDWDAINKLISNH